MMPRKRLIGKPKETPSIFIFSGVVKSIKRRFIYWQIKYFMYQFLIHILAYWQMFFFVKILFVCYFLFCLSRCYFDLKKMFSGIPILIMNKYQSLRNWFLEFVWNFKFVIEDKLYIKLQLTRITIITILHV